LIKDREQTLKDVLLSDEERQEKLRELDEKMQSIGGINMYQGASRRGEKHLNSAQWIAKQLHQYTTSAERQQVHTFWLVDVGALQPNYSTWSWVNAVSLDLHRRHPQVLEIDFLKVQMSTLWLQAAKQQRNELRRVREHAKSKRRRTVAQVTDEAESDESSEIDYAVDVDHQSSAEVVPAEFAGFDCIALSLVLNFEPTPPKRG
jgi:hypothetical protein